METELDQFDVSRSLRDGKFIPREELARRMESSRTVMFSGYVLARIMDLRSYEVLCFPNDDGGITVQIDRCRFFVLTSVKEIL